MSRPWSTLHRVLQSRDGLMYGIYANGPPYRRIKNYITIAVMASPAVNAAVVVMGIPNVRSFAAALHCIRVGSRQTCTMSLSSGGVSLVWEDESKALQGSVFLKPQLFSRFTCGPDARHEFGLSLQLLLDTLAVFASTSTHMTAYFPGAQGELVCEMADSDLGAAGGGPRQGGGGGGRSGGGGPAAASNGPVAISWARIVVLESDPPVDLGGYWTEPASSFLCAGSLLKEVVEDLELPGGPVELTMQQDPQRLVMAAVGHGSLEIEIPASVVTGFTCQEAEVRHCYKHRHLKAALCCLPHPRDCASISTKVSIDSQGLLKATHMLALEPGAGGGRSGTQLGAPPGGHEGPSEAFVPSQRQHDNSKVAVVQFLVQPTDEGV